MPSPITVKKNKASETPEPSSIFSSANLILKPYKIYKAMHEPYTARSAILNPNI